MDIKGNKSEIITLCGSTRFKEKFLEIARRFKLDNKQKKFLDNLHLKKVELFNGIFVIDVGGYIGESTKKEREYVLQNEKFVKYYSQEAEAGK